MIKFDKLNEIYLADTLIEIENLYFKIFDEISNKYLDKSKYKYNIDKVHYFSQSYSIRIVEQKKFYPKNIGELCIHFSIIDNIKAMRTLGIGYAEIAGTDSNIKFIEFDSSNYSDIELLKKISDIFTKLLSFWLILTNIYINTSITN